MDNDLDRLNSLVNRLNGYRDWRQVNAPSGGTYTCQNHEGKTLKLVCSMYGDGKTHCSLTKDGVMVWDEKDHKDVPRLLTQFFERLHNEPYEITLRREENKLRDENRLRIEAEKRAEEARLEALIDSV
jgi:hypothetical protein